MPNSSIWPIDRTLSGVTTSGQSGTGSDGNEGVLHIPQSSSITEVSPLVCLVSYLGYSFGSGGGSYPSTEMHSMFSTAPAEWAQKDLRRRATTQIPVNGYQLTQVWKTCWAMHRVECKKQFYFKQFSLAQNTVPFQTIQFSISTQFSYI